MVRKRKSTGRPEKPSKRRKSSPKVSSKPAKKTLSLLDLPAEILDIVLSYVVEVPWHPINATYHWHGHLFSPQAIHVNQLLRKRAIALIVKNTLWVNVKCQTRAAAERLERQCLALPSVPPIFRSILPDQLPGVQLELGRPAQRITHTRSFNDETASFMFAFNFHSLAEMAGSLIGGSKTVQQLAIRTSQLSMAMQKVVTEQILPIIPLLRHDLEVRVLQEGFDERVYPRRLGQQMTSTFPRADELMKVVQELDGRGRRLEATLLCMHYGYLLTIVTDHDPYLGFDDEFEPMMIGPFIWWASPAGPLGMSDWSTNPHSLERMRRTRTLHHLEYRACLGYIEAVNEYSYNFSRCHYVNVSNLPGINHGCTRWKRDMNNLWYGLPDHELAEMHHARALIYDHEAEYYDEMVKDRILDPEKNPTRHELSIQSLCWAYYAWSLDMDNQRYSAFLQELLSRSSIEAISAMRRRVIRDFENPITDGGITTFNANPRLVSEWAVNDYAVRYLPRAQEVAKQADVAYDKRRGDELPKGYTEESRAKQRDLLFPVDGDDNYPRPCECCYHGLNVEVLGEWDWEDAYGFDAVAPWYDWTL